MFSLLIFIISIFFVVGEDETDEWYRKDDSRKHSIEVNFNLQYGDSTDETNFAGLRRQANAPNEKDIIQGETITDEKDPTSELPLPENAENSAPVMRVKNQFPIKLPKSLLRIKNGNRTDPLNYPYIAAVIVNGRLWCAGAIVDVNFVVTAAHCLNYVMYVSPMKTLQDFVKVRVGSSRAHEGGVLVSVTGAIRHPKYEEEPVPHADVALLKLESSLVLSQTVNVIKIYDGMREPFAQSFIVVAGWGATRGAETAFRDHTPDLLSARLKVRTRHYCEDAYQLVNGFMFSEDFFCASLRNGTRDVCLFDAGAPAVQHNVLMGIMSFGPERCGHEYQPAVFIKAYYFRDFVKSTVTAYKTPIDLMNVMQELSPPVRETKEHLFARTESENLKMI